MVYVKHIEIIRKNIFSVWSFRGKTSIMMQKRCKRQASVILQIMMSIFIVIIFALPINGRAGDLITVKVEKIIDGDTIRVRYRTQSILVRLWGIDTPEYYQPYSKAAKKYTTRLVSNSSVRLDKKDWDDYGRMVAVVTMEDGGCLNEELLKAGFAWVHIYYCKEDICDKWNAYQKNARQKRIGLWRDKSPVPPWVHKRRKNR